MCIVQKAMPAAVPGEGNHPFKEATALDKAGPGANAAATPSLDTADSPRPLRDPSAPRIEGSSNHGFYGQDAGKSFQTDTARADPGSPHAEELQSRLVRYLEFSPGHSHGRIDQTFTLFGTALRADGRSVGKSIRC